MTDSQYEFTYNLGLNACKKMVLTGLEHLRAENPSVYDEISLFMDEVENLKVGE